MTTYYLSTNHGEARVNANITEGTSAPTADLYVAVGGNTAVAALSRSEIADALAQMVNWLRSDGNNGAAAVIPFGRP